MNNININYLKKRYLDIRLGGGTINPLMQATNFVMITYILFQDGISFWIFAPLFFSLVVILTTFAGFMFRKYQLSTDESLLYEKQIELNKTLFEIMKYQKKLADKMNIPIDYSYESRMDELKAIVK